MLHELNDQLARAADQKARLEKLRRRETDLEIEQRELKERVGRLKAAAHMEQADVDRLEGASLTGLFFSLLGSREERLHKERQEALAAQLKYDEAANRLTAVGAELERVRAELKASRDAGEEYKRLMYRKEELISQSGSEGNRQLLRFGEQEQELRWIVQQLQEAESAGDQALSALGRVADSLRSAQGWGTWDMLGGGMIATAMKHSRMDDARDHVHEAQLALSRFHRELKDVAANVQVGEVRVDGFTRFADYFFDGLIVDWVVQSKINDSLGSVQRSQSEVVSLLNMLRSRLADARAKLAQVQQERSAFLAGYQGG